MSENISWIDVNKYLEKLRPPFSNKTLYHYTSVDTLIEIIKSEKLRLTHIQYMNDSQEYRYGLQIFKDQIAKRLKKDSLVNFFGNKEQIFFDNLISTFSVLITDPLNVKAGIGHSTEKIKNTAIMRNVVPTFSFSVSEKHDDLTQWRGYAPQGGVAIGFRADKIKKYLYKCEYDLTTQTEIANGLLDIIFNLVKKGYLKHRDEATDNLGWTDGKSGGTGAIILRVDATVGMGEYSHENLKATDQLITIFKNAVFESEREWRLVTQQFFCNNQINYRSKNQMLIPFLEIPFSEFGQYQKLDEYIAEIRVGPNNYDSFLTRQAFENYVTQKIGENCCVKYSDIPYRML